MRQKPNIILGISPGTRAMGWAVLSDGELVDWGVKNFKGKWSQQSEEKSLQFIVNMLNDYMITTLAIKRINPSKSSSGLDRLYSHIIATAHLNQIEIKSASNMEIKKSQKNIRNMKQLLPVLSIRFPELNNDKKIGRVQNIKFHEAIAVATYRK
jgi:hypothetical protein